MEGIIGKFQREQARVLTVDFQAQNNQPVPFARSLQLILESITRQTMAEIACLYACDGQNLTLFARGGRMKRRIDSAHIELSPESSEWLCSLQLPQEIAHASGDYRVGSFPEVILNGLERLVVAPLRIGNQLSGILTAGWKTGDSDDAAMTVIGGLSSSAVALLARARNTEAASSMLAELARLEAELADLKIADRAGEILARSPQSNLAAGSVHQHVQRVLEGTDVASVLRQQLQELRTQVEDRKLVNQAKALLQRAHRMSEEEAYLHLRNASRRERRPIRDVAGEILLSLRPRATASVIDA